MKSEGIFHEESIALPSSRGEDVLQAPSSLRCCEELHRATDQTLSNFLFILLVL